MPNQFKCNNVNSSDSDKIKTFEVVYDYYYDKVIRNKNGEDVFDSRKFPNVGGSTWSSKYCDLGNCPSNLSEDAITQSISFSNIDRTQTSIKNKDLARYLDDCASKMFLNRYSSPDYGGDQSSTSIGTAYPFAANLRDIKHEKVLADRSDLDRKMKEVLAFDGSMVNEHQNYVDGSVYTTLLWTVMATSLVYYIFTKI